MTCGLIFPYVWVTSPPLTHTIKKNKCSKARPQIWKAAGLKPNTLGLAESTFVRIYWPRGPSKSEDGIYSFEGIRLCCFLVITSFFPVKERILRHWQFFFLSKQGEGSSNQMENQLTDTENITHQTRQTFRSFVLERLVVFTENSCGTWCSWALFSCRIFGHGHLF